MHNCDKALFRNNRPFFSQFDHVFSRNKQISLFVETEIGMKSPIVYSGINEDFLQNRAEIEKKKRHLPLFKEATLRKIKIVFKKHCLGL